MCNIYADRIYDFIIFSPLLIFIGLVVKPLHKFVNPVKDFTGETLLLNARLLALATLFPFV